MAVSDKITNLEKRLDFLSQEIRQCKDDLAELKLDSSPQIDEELTINFEEKTPIIIPEFIQKPTQIADNQVIEKTDSQKNKELENYIGGNLLSKIGVLVLVIGLAVFVKYAIDNNLVSPTLRIIFGYVAAMGLVFTAYRLKEKFWIYSAVLLSGGATTAYFTTYSAFQYYQMYPRWLTMLLMVLITIYTVWEASRFKVEWIGILGLVGAYAIPFLLSNNSGEAHKLFAYIAISNVGILWLSFRQNWIWMNSLAFFFTWLIYLTWFSESYDSDSDKLTAFGFATLFFLMNYLNQLAYSFRNAQDYDLLITIRLILNNFIYFGISLLILYKLEPNYRGLFALLNSILHGFVVYKLFHKNLKDSQLYYLVMSFALVCLVLAIPLQFDGKWVTAIWLVGAATITYFAKEYYFYVVGFVLSFFGFGSWIDDIYKLLPIDTNVVLNTDFLITLVGVLSIFSAFEIIRVREVKNKNFFSIWFGAIGVLLLFLLFSLEINRWFDNQIVSAKIVNYWDRYNSIWTQIYALLFVIGSIFYVKFRKINNQITNITLMIAGGIIVAFFLADTNFATIRDEYLRKNSFFSLNAILIRYLYYATLGIFIWVLYSWLNRTFVLSKNLPFLQLGIHFLVLIILTSELKTCTLLYDAANKTQYALKINGAGYSVLWGIYAFLLGGIGFKKPLKAFRLAGIALFGLVLIKVFLIDFRYVSTISKIITFISLGIMLLTLSFLYQKFKDKILAED